ncbi:MAG: hypothetical protein R3E42_11075 [Burkholderiaceae bacterium]
MTLLEQASAFGEVGAGLQLGPNAVRVLDAWGLLDGLKALAAFPEQLRVRDVRSGALLGALALGFDARQRYGQPYATVHRADLHGLLLNAVRHHEGVRLHLNQRVASFAQGSVGVQVVDECGAQLEGAALLGCDGLWSRVRTQLLGAHPVRSSGHLAYRGMVRSTFDLPSALRAPLVTQPGWVLGCMPCITRCAEGLVQPGRRGPGRDWSRARRGGGQRPPELDALKPTQPTCGARWVRSTRTSWPWSMRWGHGSCGLERSATHGRCP